MLFGKKDGFNSFPDNNKLRRRTHLRPDYYRPQGNNLFSKAKQPWSNWVGRSKPLRRNRFSHHKSRPLSRYRRSQNSEESAFPVQFLEPAFEAIKALDAESDCAKLFACQLAVKASLNQSLKIQENVLMLLLLQAPGVSSGHKAAFDEAARFGAATTSIDSCRLKYHRCPRADAKS